MEKAWQRAMRALGMCGWGLLAVGCSVSVESGFTQGCLERATRDALASTPTYPIAANLAGRIGFGPPRGLEAPPIPTKQVGFYGPDGSLHSIAVESPSWTKALMIRIVDEGGRPRTRLYVIDRQVRLLRAAEGYNSQVEIMDPEDPRAREGFRAEQELWRSAIPETACRSG